MATQSSMLKASGLQTYYQSLMEVPPGALLKANNSVINRDGVVEPRRGITTYYKSSDPVGSQQTIKAKQLFEYRGNILYHGNGLVSPEEFLYYLQGTTYLPYTQIYAPVSGYRIKSEEAKSNLYLTSSTGIKVISLKSNQDFSSNFNVQDAGGPKAISAYASLNYTGTGFLTGYTTSAAKVAYRILWIYTDNNDNTIFGAVSPRTIASNPSTTSGLSVDLSIPVPTSVVSNSAQYQKYKYRIYRSEVANGEPSDELYQVYEGTPTPAEISSKLVTYTDSISETSRIGGVPLYTNQNSGEGILKSNEAPPSARDISLFKGHMFYANTRTAHGAFLTLNSVTNITASSNIIITDGTSTNTFTYGFQGTKEVTTATVANGVLANYVGKWLEISSGSNQRKYAFWFDTTVGSNATQPTITAGYIPVRTSIYNAAPTTITIAASINTVLQTLTSDFITSYTGGTSVLTITNASNGDAADTAYMGGGAQITLVKNTNGTGEILSGTRKILISGRSSASEAIEETARSIVRVINSDNDCTIIASYISNTGETPGKMYFQKKNSADVQFFIGTSDTNTASATTFIPKLGLSISNTTYTMGATSTITTASAHGLAINNVVCVYGATSTYLAGTIQASVNGRAIVTAVPLATTYNILNHSTGTWYSGTTVPSNLIGANGDNYINTVSLIAYKKDSGVWSAITPITFGSTIISPVESVAEAIGNRLYYSKYQEHEAVPILNYVDIGSREQKILRIVNLRESLFILKEDGIFRLAGDPGANPVWDVGAFDTTCIIKAPDTAVTLGNQLYFFSNQGIVSVNEAGLEVVSKPIQDKFLPFISTNPNLPTASFAVPYESDRALLLWTVETKTDSVATKCYRYSIVTRAWTEWDVSKTCAVLNRSEDKMYYGSSVDNYIEVERKNFDRFDYADRQVIISLSTGGLKANVIKTSGFNSMSLGDVIYQTQYVTAFQFNTILRKLDLDPEVVTKTFYSSYAFSNGDNLTSKMTQLTSALNAIDPSSAYTFSGSADFATIQTEFNATITKLNASSAFIFTNYPKSSGMISYEAVVLALNTFKKETTLNLSPSFITGTMLLYKAIPTEIIYAPQHMGDPASQKQFSTGTFMFERRSFRTAEVGYNSDISDSYDEIQFVPASASIFGGAAWGDGSVWGGAGDQSQIRTYIPSRKQRCRFLGCKFIHTTALESFALYGLSLSYRTYAIADRTYR